MKRSVLVLYVFSLLLVLSLPACGTDSEPADDDDDAAVDGDTCGGCEAGLSCLGGVCSCDPREVDCCVSPSDCPAGASCIDHRCVVLGDDDDDNTSDGDSDGDNPTDGDQNDDDDDDDSTDGDDESDGDTESDGDSGDDDDDDTVQCPPHFGLENLTALEDLPLFRPGVQAQMTSSTARNGTEDDYRNVLYLDGSENVLMESNQPGCITRIWFAEVNTVRERLLRFYFNGESTARISYRLSEILSGENAPFLPPLVGEVSESVYILVPICYEQGMRVTLDNFPRGYHVNYSTYGNAQCLEEYSSDLNVSQAVTQLTDGLGSDPKPQDGLVPTSVNRALPSGVSDKFFEYFEEGQIMSIEMDIAPASEEVLQNTFLQIYFEDKSQPNVDVPIGLFFGSGFGEKDVTTLPVGMSTQGMWYSYLPMPYWSRVRIYVDNRSTESISSLTMNLKRLTQAPSQSATGYFHAIYREGLPVTSGQDFIIAQVAGQGQYIGTILAMESNPSEYSNAFLLGDERITIDGNRGPDLSGTGTDNYFNGSQKWRAGAYTHPLFHVTQAGTNPFQYTALRWHLIDAIPFNSSLKVGFEVGGTNTYPGMYRSIAMFYASCLSGMVLSDSLNVGTSVPMDNPITEQYHDCEVVDDYDSQGHRDQTGTFTDEQSTTFTDSGRGFVGTSGNMGYISCLFTLDPNNQGVRLVRLLDYSIQNQLANVYVDGNLVGQWYTPGNNTSRRWLESAFNIPLEFTENKTEARIKLEYASGAEFNLYNLNVYSYLELSDTVQGPGQVDADNVTYEMQGMRPLLSWLAPSSGTPPAYYHVYRGNAYNFQADETSLVGTVDTEQFLDVALSSQTTYYYKFIAEDCTGRRGPVSRHVEIDTGVPPICFEAEETLNNDVFATTMTCSGEGLGPQSYEGASGGMVLVCTTNTTTQKVTLSKIIDIAADYRIYVDAGKDQDAAIWEMQVNSQLQGNRFDGYAGGPELVTNIDMGTKVLSAANNNFSFRVTGRNENSGGYKVIIDRICLYGRER